MFHRLVSFSPPPGIWGPHLVVVRTCKLLTWEMEFKRWCPGLKILLYLGSGRERRAKRTVTCLLCDCCPLYLKDAHCA